MCSSDVPTNRLLGLYAAREGTILGSGLSRRRTVRRNSLLDALSETIEPSSGSFPHTQNRLLALGEPTVQQVWEKGGIILGKNPDLVREDVYGKEIWRHEYGNRDSFFGWERDHIIAKDNGGSDALYNLQPLHWYNNVRKSNNLV